MDSLQSRSIRVSMTVYRLLLLAYPPAHRQAYGPCMQQLFADLCRDAVSQNRLTGLLRLWLRTLADLAASLAVAYLQAAGEVLMLINRTVTPVSWGSVALVIVPGILFGISRVINPLGWLAGSGFLLVALLATGILLIQRRLPIWSLLALGVLTSWTLQLISYGLPGVIIRSLVSTNIPAIREIGNSLVFSSDSQQLIAAIPMWLAIIWLLWRYHPVWQSAGWIVLMCGAGILVASILIGPIILVSAGLVLLPVALGLPLSSQFGSLTSLYMLGVFSHQVLFDSDYYSGSLVRYQPFYALYVIPLIWMLVSIAPLLLLRAHTWRGQAIGLLAPVLVWGAARIAVPYMASPEFHPLTVWLGDALLSALVVLVLALAFYFYSQSGNPFNLRQGSTV